MSVAQPDRLPLAVGDQYTVTANNGTSKIYQVLKKVDSDNSDDGYPNNGMQAIAVAALNNGLVNLSSILIGFAATNPNNPGELNDILTDLQTVVGGSLYFTKLDGSIVAGQLITAQKFIDEIIITYPNASFAVTGISLGGYLAMAMGAKNKLPVVAFAAPDAANVLSKSQIAFVKNNTDSYFNIRNVYDLLFGGDKLNVAHYYDLGWQGLIGSHVLEPTYNDSGNIVNQDVQIKGTIINAIVTAPDALLSSIMLVINRVLPTAASITSNVITTLSPIINTAVSTIKTLAATATNMFNKVAAIFPKLNN